jgi:hypothetical protein
MSLHTPLSLRFASTIAAASAFAALTACAMQPQTLVRQDELPAPIRVPDGHRAFLHTVVQTLVSHSAYLGLRPLTMSKNALWIFSVIGPREPVPISMRSSSRIGVTSAAVPVKNASSQM